MGEAYNAAVDLLERNRSHPEKPALRQDGRVVTYAALCERANRAGNALAGLGMQMEQRVLLCMLDTPDFAAVFWGALKAGFVPVPVNTLLTTADFDYLLRDSRARVLIVSAPLLAKIEPILRGQPFLRSVVVAGDGAGAGHASLDDLLAKASPDLAPAPTRRDDVAFWLYSSGSTGQPKGAMHLHGDLAETARLYGEGVL
jgi:acyl-coenzyme A synthetase/AMP-(fatty) acid ligase